MLSNLLIFFSLLSPLLSILLCTKVSRMAWRINFHDNANERYLLLRNFCDLREILCELRGGGSDTKEKFSHKKPFFPPSKRKVGCGEMLKFWDELNDNSE